MKKVVVIAIVLLLFMVVATYAASEKIETEHFEITYEDISPEMAQMFSEKAEKAFSNVTSYLEKTYKYKIRIKISDEYEMPFVTKETVMLIPASSIRGDAGGPPEIAGRGPSLAHEITHIVAPSKHMVAARRQYRGRGAPRAQKPDRFLDEGLAVYTQEKFGEYKAIPNMGKDVHQLTAKYIKKESIIPLKEVEEVRMSSLKDDNLNLRLLAYLEEGSFVRYLIEKYGLKDFMTMYEGKSYKKVYNKSFDELETEWIDFIKGLE